MCAINSGLCTLCSFRPQRFFSGKNKFSMKLFFESRNLVVHYFNMGQRRTDVATEYRVERGQNTVAAYICTASMISAD